MRTKSSNVFFPETAARKKLTKEEAQTVFCSLGDDFWKQIIDGEYHEFGSRVFDEGLHGGVREPGFLASLVQGCEFASEHLTERLSIDFYKKLHQKLCAHFKGTATSTAMGAEKCGIFRDRSSVSCHLNLYFNLGNEEAMKHYCFSEMHDPRAEDAEFINMTDNERNQIYKSYLAKLVRNLGFKVRTSKKWLSDWASQLEDDKKLSNTIESQYENSSQWLETWGIHWQNKIIKINDYIRIISDELGIREFVSLKFDPINNIVNVNYMINDQQELEDIIQIFFVNYNNKIDEINKKLERCNTNDDNVIRNLIEEKVNHIADLFQRLEWLHPFQDGQGRTDLVILAKLLSEENSHPLILKHPYASTYSLLHEWQDNLKTGLKCWENNLHMEQNTTPPGGFVS